MLAEKTAKVFVQLEQLSLIKHKQAILDGVNLSVEDQNITALLGANGAGKSTLLRVLSGLIAPSSGNVQWPKSVQAPEPQRIAYVAEPAVFYPHLTVMEQLLFHANSHKMLPLNAEQALAQWQLSGVADKKTHQLSLGYRQRLALAQALMQRPRLLLLDEPMNGMDPELMLLFQSKLQKIKSHCCIVMASHLLHLMDEWVDEVVVMAEGQVLSQQKNDGQSNLYQIYQNSITKAHQKVAT